MGVVQTVRRSVSPMQASPSLPPVELVMGLPPRHREVLALIGMCLRDKQIARAKFVSFRTVGSYVTDLHRMLGTQSGGRMLLTATAIVYGLSRPGGRSAPDHPAA